MVGMGQLENKSKNNMNTNYQYVYGIYEGNTHEGGDIHTDVYGNIELVMDMANDLCDEYQKNDYNMYGEGLEKSGHIPHIWINNGLRWTNGVKEIIVKELRVW